MTGKWETTMYWKIDTGASNHVIGDLGCLTQVKDVLECSIKLSDGERAMAIKEGNVRLSNIITFKKNYLCLNWTNSILNSMSQLIKDEKCFLQITNSFYTLQDLYLRQLIGAGEQRGDSITFGLLWEKSFYNGWIYSLELRHKHLGHSSEKVIKLLNALNSSINSVKLNKVYDVCHWANRLKILF